ncbi:MAG: hypothetical protein HY220_01470 [Candidatus Sungbacteria bacterium]|uniref:Uncharacterized protein n=1 Tax=Candidatus Sungiibacteriota bacterium TaxID=2750080 RepID=A0A9D6LRD4_9BACT|nr:hypothetical protein [Candidatus Sungbacteria bacterium]
MPSTETKRENILGAVETADVLRREPMPATDYHDDNEAWYQRTEAEQARQEKMRSAEAAALEEQAAAEAQQIAEENYYLALSQSRRQQTLAQAERAEEAEQKAQKKIGSMQWLLLFAAVSFFSLIGYLADFIIPFIAIMIDYVIVGFLWIWRVGHQLHPASMTSGARAMKLAGVNTPGSEAMQKAEEAVPGSELVYILFSGISPLVYLFALWMSNQ